MSTGTVHPHVNAEGSFPPLFYPSTVGFVWRNDFICGLSAVLNDSVPYSQGLFAALSMFKRLWWWFSFVDFCVDVTLHRMLVTSKFGCSAVVDIWINELCVEVSVRRSVTTAWHSSTLWRGWQKYLIVWESEESNILLLEDNETNFVWVCVTSTVTKRLDGF